MGCRGVVFGVSLDATSMLGVVLVALHGFVWGLGMGELACSMRVRGGWGLTSVLSLGACGDAAGRGCEGVGWEQYTKEGQDFRRVMCFCEWRCCLFGVKCNTTRVCLCRDEMLKGVMLP